tara:strand:- start:10156 stop:10923 length:768 start_codon:yes stop_codon:yes gene_type:complete
MNNKLKLKLKNNEVTYGTWLTIPNIIIPEIISAGSFDWICIDMEHSNIELNDLVPLIVSIEKGNITPLVRVGENNANLIKRVMDAGSYGVIVPNINNSEQARKAVESVKYPPVGKRGVGLYRAQKFGKNFENYFNWVKDNSIVIIQIENIEAVQNIESIFEVEGIDGYIIGPYDLSSSLGKPGKINDPEVIEAINKIISVGNKKNITSGIHSVSTDPEEVINFKNKGFKLLGFSLDSIFLSDAVINSMNIIRNSK